MRRFLAVLAIAAIGAVLYAAVASGGQQSVPSKQLKTLKIEMAALSHKVKGLNATVSSQQATIATLKTQLSALTTDEASVKATATADHSFIATCLGASGAAGVSQFGDPSGSTEGYLYQNSSGTFMTTALDADKSSTPGAFFQTVAPSCVSSGSALPKNGVPAEHRATTLAIKAR